MLFKQEEMPLLCVDAFRYTIHKKDGKNNKNILNMCVQMVTAKLFLKYSNYKLGNRIQLRKQKYKFIIDLTLC